MIRATLLLIGIRTPSKLDICSSNWLLIAESESSLIAPKAACCDATSSVILVFQSNDAMLVQEGRASSLLFREIRFNDVSIVICRHLNNVCCTE